MADDNAEDEVEGGAVHFERGPDPDDMAAEYLPKEDDWVAKTNLDINDPHRVAVLQQLGSMYPEVDDLQPMLDDFLTEFLKGRTSVGGVSREEYGGILRSMFGGNVEDEASRMATVAKAFGSDGDD